MTAPFVNTGDVTVVVLTHNRRDELCRTLDKLLDMSERPAIIVVDNASTDDTVACITKVFPEVQIVQAPANMGAAGRNLGVQCVRTPYVAFCDDDTWWQSGSLQAAVSLFERHAQVAVLNANILVGPDERADPACSAMYQSPLAHLQGVGPMLTSFMAGACIMRTEVFLQVGGYWSPFFLGGEESLLAMDILDRDHHIVFAPALTVHHWPSQVRDSDMRRHLMARNALWTTWLRLPWQLAWQRTGESLKHTSRHMRMRAFVSALSGVRTVLPHRRVLRPETCALLAEVWQHEATSA